MEEKCDVGGLLRHSVRLTLLHVFNNVPDVVEIAPGNPTIAQSVLQDMIQ